MEADRSSVNVGSTKSHGSEKSNIRRLLKDSHVPSSAMKDAAQNEC